MKPITKSRTMWFAFAVTVLGIWDQVSPVIPPDWSAKIITVIGPIVAALRWVTKEPVAPPKK